jgi:hypothetical protein
VKRHRVVTGRYALTDLLSQRAGRRLWRAQDTVLRRDVAVEELRLGPVSSASLLREARAAGRLPLPGTITVFDAVRDGDQLFVVTELVTARTLAEVLAQDGPLAPERVAALGLELLAVVEGVQRRRIVHEGIGPSAILLVDGHAKLRGVGLGSGADLDTDLADLAATLHQAVSGQEPEAADALAGTLAALLAIDPADRAADPALLEALRDLVPAAAPRPVGAVSATRRAAAPTLEEPAEPAPVPISGGSLWAGEARGATATDTRPAPPVQAPAQATAPAERRPRWLAVAVLALLTFGAAVLAIALLVQDRSTNGAERTAAQAPARPLPAPATTTAPVRTAWQLVEDREAGFGLRVPLGWHAERRPGRAAFRSADGAVTVAVSWAGGRPDPLAVLRDRAEQFAGVPGYRQARLGPVRFRGRDAAAWEYVAGGLHGRALAVNGARGSYLFVVEVPEGRWAGAERLVDQVEEGFMVG